MINKKTTDILLYIVSAEVAGLVSALLSGDFSSFFTKYDEPALLPPSWLFPVVWVILYALMGYSAYRIDASSADRKDKRRALTVYWIQLLVNFSWSIVFFRFEALILSSAVIVALLALIVLMIILFYRIDKIAAKLNIPYLAWVAFATYLNIATAIINR